MFRSGDESVLAKYKWYVGRMVSGRWVIDPPVLSGEGHVSQRASRGVGRLSFGGGMLHLLCGDFRLKWSPPAHVYFYESQFRDEGNEIAVTYWDKFSDLDPNCHGLNWLRMDSKRKSYVIKREAFLCN